MVRQEDWRRDHPAVHPAFNALAELSLVLVHLSPRDLAFAESLAAQYQARSSLSDKQLYWVKELTKRATNAAIAPRAQAATSTPAPQPATTFPRIVELFAKAGSRAAIVFRADGDLDFRLSVAGERSQQPGSVNVTDAGKGFADRTWYGRITTAGAWQPSRKIPASDIAAVEAALTLFDADPDAASAAYGRETGICCFCSRELTDERSVSVGRGPVCSARWGLPWGEVPGSPKLTAEAVSNAKIPF